MAKSYTPIFYMGWRDNVHDNTIRYTKLTNIAYRHSHPQYVPTKQIRQQVQDNVALVVRNGTIVTMKNRFRREDGLYPFPYTCNNEQKQLLIPPTDHGAAIIEHIVQSDLELNNLTIEDEFTLLMMGATCAPKAEATEFDFDKFLTEQGLKI